MKKFLGSLTVLPLVAAGFMGLTGTAQAADIVTPIGGPFTDVYAFSSIPGSGNGVNVKIAGGTATFDFLPPVGGGYGTYDVDLATGAFIQFGGTSGRILDFTLPFPIAPNAPVPVAAPGFLDLDNGVATDSTFDLVTAFGPTFTVNATSTIVSFAFEGFFKQGTTTYAGQGSISSTFVGLTPAQIIAAASSPTGITTSQSGTFTLQIEAVPEPASLAGLAMVAGAMVLTVKRNRKA